MTHDTTILWYIIPENLCVQDYKWGGEKRRRQWGWYRKNAHVEKVLNTEQVKHLQATFVNPRRLLGASFPSTHLPTRLPGQ